MSELAKSLSNNYMFRGLPPETITRLAEIAKVRDYSGGEQLVRQFDGTSDLLILLEGDAITRTFSGEVVAKFGPGTVIGEVALLDRQKRSANVTSVGKSKAAVLPAEEFWKLMDEDPAVGYAVLKNLSTVLCMRLRSMNAYADTAGPLRGEPTAKSR